MAIAYFDCFAGAAGDMIVGSLIAAGADASAVAAELGKLGIEGLSVKADRTRRRGLAGVQFSVDWPHAHEHEHSPTADEQTEHQHADEHEHAHQGEHAHAHAHEHTHDAPHQHPHAHRPLSEIVAMIHRAGLAPRVADRARRIFQRLGEAEAKMHGIAIEEVAFHEVGAFDSIADIVGACVAMELLHIDRVVCSELPTAGGTVHCAHGELPLPAPATMELIARAKAPVRPSDAHGELVTPTAAAVLTVLAEAYGPIPAMCVTAAGFGAGERDTGPMPNLLRVLVGELDDDGGADAVMELSANVDDCSGELLGATLEKLIAAGCLDAWAAPIVMKKSRPAWMISALCSADSVGRVERILFSETTTFGVRRRRADRSKLSRRHDTVETPYGPVRVKVGRQGERVMTAAPEYADCAAAAECHGVPVKEVMVAAQAAWRAGEFQ